MARIQHHLAVLFLAILSLTSLAAAASAPTFCKCTCFTNSTIIPLGPQSGNPPAQPPPPPSKPNTTPANIVLARGTSSSCTQCNRAFCLNYNLPICKDAEEKDVLTSCFQRDSRKDQIIVWGFILGTAGLLGWAGVRRLLEMREGRKTVFGSAGGSGLVGGTGRVASAFGRRGGGGGGVDNRDRGAYSPLEDPRRSAG
ncbi:hypothetical protein B0T22DRAFT_432815 [Podospora appendiculata]|uniref:Uncharacterized protein n=1 Tax=Podospora appendiculata TaxID=314037 RepID=A0AAE0X118_9PEZI|nr:hypothetical protein B0T22DRAFT_432815 [Podospora appendiculata]